MFCYDSGYRRWPRGYSSFYDPIYAYPRGEGYSFYKKRGRGEHFIRWFKGNKEIVRAKMDKYMIHNSAF